MQTMRTIPDNMPHPIETHLWAVLDAVPFAVVLIGRDLKVRGMNSRGQTLLRDADAVRFDGSRLRATASEIVDERLQSALASGECCVLRLDRLSKQRAMEVSVLSLDAECSAVIIGDPSRAIAPRPEHLRRLYGLTPTEARVAAAVVQGAGGQSAARELGMSVNTLRRHLKSVFIKTQVERQSELVRVLLSGIAALNFERSDSNR